MNLDTFDGAMIVLAMWTLNIGHPGLLLREQPPPVKSLSDSSMELTSQYDRV